MQMNEEVSTRVPIYRDAEKELKQFQEKSEAAQGSLWKAHDELSTMEVELNKAIDEKRKGKFDTAESITNAREKVKATEAAHKDKAELIKDIELVTENISTKIRASQKHLTDIKRMICGILAEEKAEEIQRIAGELFHEYVAFAIIANYGNHPFRGGCIPGNLSFITADGTDGIRDDAFRNLLNKYDSKA